MQLTFAANCLDGGGACATTPTASFSGGPQTGAAPLAVTFTNQSTGATSYLWAFGDTGSSSSINPIHTYTNAGTYTVSLSAINGTTTNVLTQPNYIVVTNAPPSISSQPQGTNAPAGIPFSISVTASGTPVLQYQWRFGGGPVNGATDSSLTIPNPGCGNSGNYDVVISNPGGSITSSVAAVTIVAPPYFLAQPTNQTAVVGSAATLVSSGTNNCGDSLGYQWQLSGTNLPGATRSAVTFASVQLSNAGPYRVILSTLAGTTNSQVANLTVVTPAVLAVSPGQLHFSTILTGTTAQASFTISNSGGAHLTGTASLSGGTPFSFAQPGQAQWDLVGFSATNLTISFAPSVSGSYSNNVQFTSNGGNLLAPISGAAVDNFAPVIVLPVQTPGQLVFSFDTVPGKTYFIETNSSPVTAGWSTQGSVPGDGSTKMVTNTIGPANTFYRLRVQ